jgi:hypothetical protein
VLFGKLQSPTAGAAGYFVSSHTLHQTAASPNPTRVWDAPEGFQCSEKLRFREWNSAESALFDRGNYQDKTRTIAEFNLTTKREKNVLNTTLTGPLVRLQQLDEGQFLYIAENGTAGLDSLLIGGAESKLVPWPAGTAAIGWGFIQGMRRLCAVDSSGKAWLLDRSTGNFEASAELDWVAAFVNDSQRQTKIRVQDFVFSSELAAVRLEDCFEIHARQGKARYKVRCKSIEKFNPTTGLPRGSTEVNLIKRNPLYLRGEGANLPDNIASKRRAHLVPINDQQLGLLDFDYQRMIVFSPPVKGD